AHWSTLTPACIISFFFQAEDGIRDFHVTGVQTCALPISGAIPTRQTRREIPQMKAPAIKLTGIAMGMLLSASALAVNPGNPDPGTPPGTGFPAVSDFAASGPFSVTNSNVNTTCAVYRPRTLGENGLKHPIILWGNGTGGSPSTYGRLLEHWASHGFVVAAARTSNAGTGEEMISCLNYLI